MFRVCVERSATNGEVLDGCVCVCLSFRERELLCVCVCEWLCSDLEKWVRSLKLLVYVFGRGLGRTEVMSAEMKGVTSSDF